jgi:hypothetical protein
MEAVPVGIIVGAPLLTSIGFKFAFVENILVRLLFIGALIYSIRFVNDGGFLSLLVLLAVVVLLIERNQAIVSGLPDVPQIKGPTNLYPMKPAENIFTHIQVAEVYDANESSHEEHLHMEDSIPDLKEGPVSHDAPSFYKSLGLV